MPRYRPRIRAVAPLTASVCALTAFAAPAGAATVTTAPCVVAYDGLVRSMPIVGTGFTPGGLVSLRYNSVANPTPQSLTSASPNAQGNFVTASFPASFKSSTTRQQTFNLIATDATNPGIQAVTQFRQVSFGGTVKPNRGRPRRKIRYRVRGFTPGKGIYIHYRFRGRTRKNVRLGTASRPCGKATRKLRLLPTRVRYGTWHVYIDQSPKYSKDTPVGLHTRLSIYRAYS